MANSERLIVRTDSAALARWNGRAQAEGQTLSDWVRATLDGSIDPPKPTPIATSEPIPTRRKTVQELAAMLGGKVTVGMPTPEAVPQVDWPDAEPEPEPEPVRTKPWLPELQRIMRMAEVEPEQSTQEFRRMLGGSSLKPPKGWSDWSINRRANYLDEKHPLQENV